MIIVGLGNPGEQYAATRHNVGFMIVDRLVETSKGSPWKTEKDVSWSKIGDHWIVKPQAFMNTSGRVLQKFFAFKKIIPPDEVLAESFIVVHDEIDFPENTLKLQSDRGAAGHNGVQSIIDAWGGWNGFRRLRFGIGNNRAYHIPSEAYVLQPFTAEQRKLIDPAIDRAVELLVEKLR